MKLLQDTWECCNNCYSRFWAFEEPVIFCIICGDWDQLPSIEVINNAE